ncbi:MAG: hypothetical protein ACRC33_11440, partial [Gemmataceae bacterium]
MPPGERPKINNHGGGWALANCSLCTAAAVVTGTADFVASDVYGRVALSAPGFNLRFGELMGQVEATGNQRYYDLMEPAEQTFTAYDSAGEAARPAGGRP